MEPFRASGQTPVIDPMQIGRFLSGFMHMKRFLCKCTMVSQIDRVLRSLEDGNGSLSGVLAKEIPALAREGVWADIQAALNLLLNV